MAASRSKNFPHHQTSEFRRFSHMSPKQRENRNNNNFATRSIRILEENPDDGLFLPPIKTKKNQARKFPAKTEDVRLPRLPAKTDLPLGRYARRPIQKPGRKDIPVSIETEHRFIVTTANQASMEVKGFRKSYRTAGFDLEKCEETAMDIVKHINLEEGEIERADEFRKLLATRRLGSDINNRKETEHLEILCDQAGKFEEMMPDITAKLTACKNNHLAKYCRSFSEECRNVEIQTIIDHEQSIKTIDGTLEENLKDLNDSYEKYNSDSVPFITGFLKNAGKLITLMDEVTSKAISVCENMKKWVKLDKGYPVKLWEEVTHGNHERNKKQEEVKKASHRKEEFARVLHKKELIRDKAAVSFNEAKVERRKLKTHKENLDKRLEQTETEWYEKDSELQEVKEEYNTRKYNSPKYVEKLWSKIERLEIETMKLDERLNMLKRQKERYSKLEVELDESLTDLEYDVMGKQGDVDDLRSKIKSCDQEIVVKMKEVKDIEATIATCRTIREMKLSAATLRKIYFQKLDSSSQDILMEVCRVVASNIGHDWEALYLDLLCKPPRSLEKRHKDLDNLKLNSVRREVTGKKLAWQALQKWRIFNKNGNVLQIVRSLKRLEKFALAHKVEHMHKKAISANP